MKRLFGLIVVAFTFAGCSSTGGPQPYVPLDVQLDKVDYDYYYPPVEMLESDYIADWMLPDAGILTYAEDTGKGYFEFTVGNLNGVQYDRYLETLVENGMEQTAEETYANDTVEIRLMTAVFNRNPGMQGDIYASSYLDVYIYDKR